MVAEPEEKTVYFMPCGELRKEKGDVSVLDVKSAERRQLASPDLVARVEWLGPAC